jgi:anti-sigma factor RsiW
MSEIEAIMNCSEAKELIQLYVDNELDARTTLETQRHLEACSSCSHVLDAYLTQDRALRMAARSTKVDSNRLRQNILAAIRNEPQVPRSNRSIFSARKRIAAIVTLAVSVTLVSVILGLMPGFEGNVYASAATDHADHCSIQKTVGAVTDPGELLGLVEQYGNMKAVPDVSPFGYGNPRGRLCRVAGLKFLHLVYYHESQEPLSVFLRPHDPGVVGARLTTVELSGYTVGSASDSRVDLIAVSSLDRHQTSRILEEIVAHL